MKAPVSYQGGKTRLASKIAQLIGPITDQRTFIDLCCGSGAVSLEMIDLGYVQPHKVYMIDAGPWGLFWKEIGRGAFDVNLLAELVHALPEDPKEHYDAVHELVARGITSSPYFLLLQAASFGSKAISVVEGKFKHHGFRKYWERGGKHVCTFHPNPHAILERVATISTVCRGVYGLHVVVDPKEFYVLSNRVYYCDPPYRGSTGSAVFSSSEFLNTVQSQYVPTTDVYLSEGYVVPSSIEAHKLSGKTRQGGISGGKKTTEEWLLRLK